MIAAFITLFLVGLVFGCLPFIPTFRPLPRWIRIALHMIGLSFFGGATFAVALDVIGPRISPQIHRLIFAHIILIFGMGVGIILLLVFSGEYLKALRDLQAARKSRSVHSHEEHGQEGV
jgi:hypothetical protein